MLHLTRYTVTESTVKSNDLSHVTTVTPSQVKNRKHLRFRRPKATRCMRSGIIYYLEMKLEREPLNQSTTVDRS